MSDFPELRGVAVYTAAELAQLDLAPATLLVVDGVRLSAGQRVLVYGPPGALKTMAVLCAALDVAERGDAVLLLSGEGTASTIGARLSGIARGRGTELGAVADRLVLAHGAIDLVSEDADDFLQDLTERVDPSLVIIDTFATYFVGEENSASSVSQFLRAVGRWAEGGIAVVLIHHPRKPSEKQHGDMRGSSALRGWADMIYRIDRRDAGLPTSQIIHEKARDEELAVPQTARFTFEADGRIGVAFDVTKETPDSKSKSTSKRSVSGLVLAELNRAGAPMTKTAIANAIGRNTTKTGEALEELVARAQVCPVEHPAGRKTGAKYELVRERPDCPVSGPTDPPL